MAADLSRFRRAALAALVALALPPVARAQGAAQEMVITATRLDTGLPGSATTVIDQAEIARSPARSLPDLLALQPGVELQDFYGNGGAKASVDLRGFGATGTANTLILLNGRRLNALDLGAVDLAGIPLDSIERIEVTRGNAGAVLYGDGAEGGVINIITKPAAGTSSARIDVAGGSFRYRAADAEATQSFGATSVSAFGKIAASNGYRENNGLLERNLNADWRQDVPGGSLYATLQLDDQRLGLPGGRRVTLTSSQLDTDPTGAATPGDLGLASGRALTLGGRHDLGGGAKLILDGGVRRKELTTRSFSFVTSELTTWSLTPRVQHVGRVMGAPLTGTAGIDVYYSDYHAETRGAPMTGPYLSTDARQTSAALYAQETWTVTGGTAVTAGLRGQEIAPVAGAIYDPAFDPFGPGGSATQPAPLRRSETQWAANLGIDQRITRDVALFGHVARSFRSPNIDERALTAGNAFDLATQTSREIEAGARYAHGPVTLTASAFLMTLKNEIAFDPVNFVNRNLDPTRRYGGQVEGSFVLSKELTARAGVALTEAHFADGPNDGNAVPLVAPWTATASVDWNAPGGVQVTAAAHYVGEKRLDNDQANFQPKIPDHTVLDLRAGGRLGPLDWSAQVNNLTDERYFEYGVASTTTFGTYNAYPLPGRTFLMRLGGRF